MRDTIRQIISAEPRPMRAINPNIPIAVEKAVNRCLRKSAEERYQTAEELRLALLKLSIGARPRNVKRLRARRVASGRRHRFTISGLSAPTMADIIHDFWSTWPTVELN